MLRYFPKFTRPPVYFLYYLSDITDFHLINMRFNINRIIQSCPQKRKRMLKLFDKLKNQGGIHV